MSSHFIINDTYFGKIKEVPISGETIKHFIDDVLYKHPNWHILLKNLSDIYVLVASLSAQKLLKDSDITWKDIMKKQDYEILEKNNYFIIGYMLITEKNQNVHYIDLFDTIIRNYNLGYVMIQKYEKNYDVVLVPQEIIHTSARYWAKIFDLNDEKDIEEFIEAYELESNDLSWEYLYELFSIKFC